MGFMRLNAMGGIATKGRWVTMMQEALAAKAKQQQEVAQRTTRNSSKTNQTDVNKARLTALLKNISRG